MADMKIKWWNWFPFQPWRVVEMVEYADDVAERLPRNGVSVVGRVDVPKWLVFDCPCRSGHRIMINADPSRRPFWNIATSARRVSVMPSIDCSSSDYLRQLAA